MVSTTPTVLWNDSCSIEELSYSISHGAVGATCNPVIVGQVLKREMHLWKDRIPQIIAENPCATDSDIAWKLTEEMSKKAAALLMPVFEREGGRNGRLSSRPTRITIGTRRGSWNRPSISAESPPISS